MADQWMGMLGLLELLELNAVKQANEVDDVKCLQGKNPRSRNGTCAALRGADREAYNQVSTLGTVCV